MILAVSIQIAFAMLGLAMLLNLFRFLRGPDLPDRVVALDTLYINAIALLVLLGIHFGSSLYFESAIVLALMGFIGAVAFSKHLLRGDIIE